MKQPRWPFLLIVFGWACSSGNNSADKEPADVVKVYIKEMYERDFDAAKQYASRKYRSHVEYMEKLLKEEPESFKVREHIKEEHYELNEKTDSTARVVMTGRLKEGNLKIGYDVELVREREKWLIDTIKYLP